VFARVLVLKSWCVYQCRDLPSQAYLDEQYRWLQSSTNIQCAVNKQKHFKQQQRSKQQTLYSSSLIAGRRIAPNSFTPARITQSGNLWNYTQCFSIFCEQSLFPNNNTFVSPRCMTSHNASNNCCCWNTDAPWNSNLPICEHRSFKICEKIFFKNRLYILWWEVLRARIVWLSNSNDSICHIANINTILLSREEKW
jgi:hypothetical protein